MRILIILTAILFALIEQTKQDIYMHNPRGSNNRLNEKSATRTTDDRLFDSQNNERGGYNVGDATNQAFQTEDQQYQMRYFQSGSVGKSYLTTEWTEQHGCGGNEDTNPTKQNCIVVLQYMCQEIKNKNDLDRLRDGLTTIRQDYTQMGTTTGVENDKNAYQQRKSNDVKLDRGLHEPWEWYDKCRYRSRNANLFTADQNLKVNEKKYSSAIYTRQNPNGDRNGYECPEERDYYPYWHPTPWTDIAVLTSNTTLCNKIFNSKSFNVRPYEECVEFYADQTRKHWSKYNNEQDCVTNNGRWLQFYNYLEKATQYTSQSSCESQSKDNIVYKWALAYDTQNVNQKECLILPTAPICNQADWTRSNHLGNTLDSSTPSNFTWTLPYFPSKSSKRCVFRIRYNISTDDYDPFGTDSKSNNQNSPIRNNPLVDIGINNHALRLALNTAQYGRVFQDRSHVFYLLPRPNEISDKAILYNLNVRGKRGNIVQTYPAVEYDFIPNNLVLKAGDYVHVQWTGSNTHNNGAPGGDGQTGDAGNGQTGTDRSNFVEIQTLNENYPLPYESTSFWNDVNIIAYLNMIITDTNINSYLLPNSNSFSKKDLALYFSTSGYYQCVSSSTCEQSYNKKTLLDVNLNNASASFSGAILSFKYSSRTYYYMCSRNNDFSNRSQKGSIRVL